MGEQLDGDVKAQRRKVSFAELTIEVPSADGVGVRVTWMDLSSGTSVAARLGAMLPPLEGDDQGYDVVAVVDEVQHRFSPEAVRAPMSPIGRARVAQLLNEEDGGDFLSHLLGSLLFPGVVGDAVKLKRRTSEASELRVALRFEGDAADEWSWLPWELADVPSESGSLGDHDLLGYGASLSVVRRPTAGAESSVSLERRDRVVLLHGDLEDDAVKQATEACRNALGSVDAADFSLADLLEGSVEISDRDLVVLVAHGVPRSGGGRPPTLVVRDRKEVNAQDLLTTAIGGAGVVVVASCFSGTDKPSGRSVAAELAEKIPLVIGLDAATHFHRVGTLVKALRAHTFDPFAAVRSVREPDTASHVWSEERLTRWSAA